MKTRFAVFGLILGVFLTFAPRTFAHEPSWLDTISKRAETMAEIMTLIERTSFYKLSEKELNDISECISTRPFFNIEVKKDALKEDFKIPSCFPQDKRAMYLTPAAAKEMEVMREGHFGGIGISVGLDKDINGLLIQEILEGAPAEKDGRLKPGDIISAAGEFVEGKETKLVRFKGLDMNKMTEKIKGAPGTKVALEVWRAGQKLPLLVLTREDVKIKNIKTSVVEPGIGYLKLNTFDSKTAHEKFYLAVKNFEDKGIQKLIIDLRKNSGGLMNVAISISSLFAPKKNELLLETRGRRSDTGGTRKERFLSPEKGPFAGFKVAILIDGWSASASEIMAGSLKIWGAKIVGVKSYGKGSVQTHIPLSDGGRFILTVALYYLADGKTPEDGGIEPDFKIEDDPRTPDIDEALAVATGILMAP